MEKAWYRDLKILFILLFPILVLVIWIGGPTLGLKDVNDRFYWIFGLLIFWVFILLAGGPITRWFSSLFVRMAQREPEPAPTATSPQKLPEVQLLRQRLMAAIDTLKQSRIGKAQGTAALYELPWYLMLGFPGSGKSTSILQSGLSFPLAGKGALEVRGTGATQNCDWFFSTEGVLLDLAGRYTTQPESRVEWLEFLKLLRKHRPKAPVNGVVMAVPITELANHQAPEFAEYARQMRQRLYELEEAFGAKVPVYLLITKMDLFPGFTDFFEHMNEDERRQSWGSVLSHRQHPGFDHVQAVGQHMDILLEGLVQVGQDRMAGQTGRSHRPVYHAFPAEFRGLKEALAALVGHLVEKDPFHSRPLIRGFHFTSSLQAPQPGWALGQRIASVFDLDRSGLPRETAGPQRSYFLQGFFETTVFPDQFLIGHRSTPQSSPARSAALLVGAVATALLMGGWLYSLINNFSLIKSVREEGLRPAAVFSTQSDLSSRMLGIQALQLQLERLEQYQKDGAFLKYGWGLYTGEELEKTLRAEYFQLVKKNMLIPVKANLEEVLRKDVLNEGAGRGVGHSAGAGFDPDPDAKRTPDDIYNALKLYLMLHTRARMDSAHFQDQLPKYWRPSLLHPEKEQLDPDLLNLVTRTVAYFSNQAGKPDVPILDLEDRLVEDVRAHLKGARQSQDPLDRAYAEIKNQGSVKFKAVKVGEVLGNKDADLVAGSYQIPGCFTQDAWENYIQGAILDAVEGKFSAADWVMASSFGEGTGLPGDKQTNTQKLIARYKRDYAEEWRKFIQGVAVLPFKDIGGAVEGLGRLSDPGSSALRVILARTAAETSLDNPGSMKKTVSKWKDKLEAILGKGNLDGTSQFGEVGRTFQGVGRMVERGEGAKPAIEGYLDILKKVQARLSRVASEGEGAARGLVQATMNQSGSELAEGQQYVEGMLSQVDEAFRPSLRALLLRPLQQSFTPVLGETERELNRTWERKVLRYWSDLADKYPFSDASNEAALPDIVRFFKPGEGPLQQFVDKDLGALVARRGSQLSPRTWGNAGIRFSPNFLPSISRLLESTEAALREGEASRFELQPTPTPGIQEIELEIDGKTWRYKNGPQAWEPFTWSGASSQGVRLQVLSNSGAAEKVHAFPSRLGLLRLLEQARASSKAGSVTLEWKFTVGRGFGARGGREVGDRVEFPSPIRFNYRYGSGNNPLELLKLRRLGLPAKACS